MAEYDQIIWLFVKSKTRTANGISLLCQATPLIQFGRGEAKTVRKESNFAFEFGRQKGTREAALQKCVT